MARYNEVTIGTVYLTQTGLVGGKPCKTAIEGLAPLKKTKTGQIISSANGTPYAQVVANGKKGLPLVIKTEWMSKAVFDSIVALHETAVNAGTSISLLIDGDTGTFNLTVIPNIPEDILFDAFSNGIIKGATFKYRTT